MNIYRKLWAGLAVVALLALSPAQQAKDGAGKDEKQQTFSGVISDTMCGAKHTMAGSAADCARSCVDAGSKYALVSGTKLYILEGKPEDVGKLAGEKVKVTGTLKGDTVQVTSVEKES